MLLNPDEAPGPLRESAARSPLRIVLADDAVLLREGLVRLLSEDGHQVVAVVGDGPALVEAVLRHRPDVSIVDVRMPPTHTDEGLRAAMTGSPGSRSSWMPWTGSPGAERCSTRRSLPSCWPGSAEATR